MSETNHPHPRLERAAWMAAALAALVGTFVLYARPAFLVTLIDQIWSCF
ncbi:hypothetical protein [Variovorax sp.]|nr:hypothetical protein [Variovorax sp.]HYP84012.1 hypothetical protein [Variovorax sp.]